jgi:septal ring factor EnvC (AmiA/AmiB activator)
MAQSDAKAEPRLDRIRLQERQQTPPDKETEELERRLEKLDALHAGLPDTIREAKARWKAEGAAEAEARWRAKDEGKGPRQPA